MGFYVLVLKILLIIGIHSIGVTCYDSIYDSF